MKKLLISGAILWVAIILFSCKGDSGSNNMMLNHYKMVYNRAVSYGDYLTAENAIYQQLTLDTANAISYKDSLANLYYKGRQFVQTIVVGKDILTKQPDDIVTMEHIAIADQDINNLNEALNYYQIIYSKLNDLFHLYKIALVQFNLSRTDECNQTIDKILTDTASARQRIPIVNGQGQTQNVTYKAAVLNMRGVIEKGLNQKDAAKNDFQDALAADPDFGLAKTNLEELKK